VFWIGLNPGPFTKVFQASIRQVVSQATTSSASAATRAGNASPSPNLNLNPNPSSLLGESSSVRPTSNTALTPERAGAPAN
jgi:hypothetical protein